MIDDWGRDVQQRSAAAAKGTKAQRAYMRCVQKVLRRHKAAARNAVKGLHSTYKGSQDWDDDDVEADDLVLCLDGYVGDEADPPSDVTPKKHQRSVVTLNTRLAGSASKGADIRELPNKCIVVVMDIETEGWGANNDHIIELAAEAWMVVKGTNGGREWTSMEQEFSQHAKSLLVNRKVAGNKHLTDAQLRDAQSEADLMCNFVDYLKLLQPTGEGQSTTGVWLAAHNGISFDFPAIHRAFSRADMDSSKEFADASVDGVLDTLLVSEDFVHWASWVYEQDEEVDENCILDEESPEWAVYEEKAQLLRHNVAAILQRVSPGSNFANAHRAAADVSALVEILTSDEFSSGVWAPKAVRETRWGPGMTWDWVRRRADANAHSNRQRDKGWDLRHRVTCHHGAMLIRTVPVKVDGEDEWRVTFTCKRYHKDSTGHCPDVIKGAFPGYVIEAPPARVSHGSIGACTCTAACKRGCPCKTNGTKCTPSCHAKNLKCTNQPASASV